MQLDFSYTQVQSDPEERPISSFVAEFTNDSPETKILCLSPLETAAEKFSALLWRVNKRNRRDEQDDPTMIRHLQDLHALRGYVHSRDTAFYEMVNTSFEADEKKIRRFTGMALPEAIERMLDKLNGDEMYKVEYDRFVSRMSYAKSEDMVSFEDAVDFLGMLANKF